jgi:hypothetical protein
VCIFSIDIGVRDQKSLETTGLRRDQLLNPAETIRTIGPLL